MSNPLTGPDGASGRAQPKSLSQRPHPLLRADRMHSGTSPRQYRPPPSMLDFRFAPQALALQEYIAPWYPRRDPGGPHGKFRSRRGIPLRDPLQFGKPRAWLDNPHPPLSAGPAPSSPMPASEAARSGVPPADLPATCPPAPARD